MKETGSRESYGFVDNGYVDHTLNLIMERQRKTASIVFALSKSNETFTKEICKLNNVQRHLLAKNFKLEAEVKILKKHGIKALYKERHNDGFILNSVSRLADAGEKILAPKTHKKKQEKCFQKKLEVELTKNQDVVKTASEEAEKKFNSIIEKNREAEIEMKDSLFTLE